jgi:hypothetical protein
MTAQAKPPFGEWIIQGLIYAGDHPLEAPKTGLLWLSDYLFVAHSAILACNFHCSKNGMCYNLRTHGFHTGSATETKYREKMRNLPDPSKWKLHWHFDLTRQSITPFTKLPWIDPRPKRSQNPIPSPTAIPMPMPMPMPTAEEQHSPESSENLFHDLFEADELWIDDLWEPDQDNDAQ